MLFNSTDFFVFFGVFLLAWFLVRDRLAARNWLLVVASYIFYAWWDYRFTALLLFSSLVDYFVGRGMGRKGSSSSSSSPSEPFALGRARLLPSPDSCREASVRREPRPGNVKGVEDEDENEDEDDSTKFRRKLLLIFSLASNLGVLFFFKYFDFFRESTRLLLGHFGVEAGWTGLQFILPVGISFYTFQTLSYTIDVYRGRLAPTRDLGQFLAYVAFFPQLIAGPIERGAHLLPQMARQLKITLPMIESGLWLFLWGLFKKVVLADGFGHLVDPVFSTVQPEASQTLIATMAFALQIYCDFSGYTDMARGLARMLGFDLMLNFNLPYFATSVQEFWRRWHISLSTWLRDYLYVPLGGNRLGPARTYLNLLIVMLLGGLWHGAAWNFVAWGLWQGLGLMVNRAWSETVGRGSRRALETEPPVGTVAPRGPRTSTKAAVEEDDPGNRVVSTAPAARAERRALPRIALPSWLGWLLTMLFTLYGWLLFRATSAEQVLTLTASLAHWSPPVWAGVMLRELLVLAAPLLAMQLWQWRTGDLEVALRLPRWARGLLQAVLIYAIILFWQREAPAFIYFQF
jgi:alginate O-acetyltransferase complex protein AlgI